MRPSEVHGKHFLFLSPWLREIERCPAGRTLPLGVGVGGGGGGEGGTQSGNGYQLWSDRWLLRWLKKKKGGGAVLLSYCRIGELSQYFH